MNNLDLMLSKYNIVAISKYKDKLTLVPCDDSQSGYYPKYDLAVPFESEYQFILPKFVECDGDEYNVDGIIFIKTDKGVQIHCVEYRWDGFQIITEECG